MAPSTRAAAERDEQRQLEGHRRLGGMAEIIPADPDGLDSAANARRRNAIRSWWIFVVLVCRVRRSSAIVDPRGRSCPTASGSSSWALRSRRSSLRWISRSRRTSSWRSSFPALIFEAAYRIDLRDLMPNLPAITVLATVGVLVTAANGGADAQRRDGALRSSLAFLVGTMLAATDPAADHRRRSRASARRDG